MTKNDIHSPAYLRYDPSRIDHESITIRYRMSRAERERKRKRKVKERTLFLRFACRGTRPSKKRKKKHRDGEKKSIEFWDEKKQLPRFNHIDSYSRDIRRELEKMNDSEEKYRRYDEKTKTSGNGERQKKEERTSGKSGRKKKERKCVVRSGTYFLFYVQRGASLFGPRQAEELEECSRHVAP